MDLSGLGLLLLLTYCTYTIALPKDYHSLENMPLGKFAEILENIRNFKLKEDLNHVQPLQPPSEKRVNENSHYGLFLPLDNAINVRNIPKDFPDDTENVEKRQGDWDFDYGLGGGRWGKRGDTFYGTSKIRFGRNVDHVDPFNPDD